MEGSARSLTVLADQVSHKIEQMILDHATNLMVNVESRDERIAHIVKRVKPGKFPTVHFRIKDSVTKNQVQSRTVNNEFAYIFQKAGFTVVDDKAERKPDVIIVGSAAYDIQEGRHGMTSTKASLVVTVQERKTGKIVLEDSEDATATDLGKATATRGALQSATIGLAERLLVLLAKPADYNNSNKE